MYPHCVYWSNYWRLYSRTSSQYYFDLKHAKINFFQLRGLSWRPNPLGDSSRLCSPLLWRYLKASWTRACALGSGGPCLSRELESEDLQWSLPTDSFCDSVNVKLNFSWSLRDLNHTSFPKYPLGQISYCHNIFCILKASLSSSYSLNLLV